MIAFIGLVSEYLPHIRRDGELRIKLKYKKIIAEV
jgi:hypothetical protein